MAIEWDISMGYNGTFYSQLYLFFLCLKIGDPTPHRTVVLRGNMMMVTFGSAVEGYLLFSDKPSISRVTLQLESGEKTSHPTGAFQPAGPTIP